jgi:diguanylate cyclase (GGDEF)-like protein
VTYQTRTLLVFTVLAAALLVVVVGAVSYAFREFGRASAMEQARIAAEIVRVSLTEAMANGTIARRGQFLDRLDVVKDLKEVYVLRGSAVVQQYGAGLIREQATDEVEAQVLVDGRPRFEELERAGEPVLRATIPYVADNHQGQPPCLSCHQVAAGTVLGAVRVTISLGEMQRRALAGISVTGGAIALFTLAGLYFLRRRYKPIVSAAHEVQRVVAEAAAGDFSARMPASADHEGRKIAEAVNRLMGTLQEAMDGLSRKVSELLRYQLGRSRNMLAATAEIVDGLVEASRFKQEVEEDETKEEVYERLANVIRNKFDLRSFSIYEVANSKNRITPAVVDGEAHAELRWCDQQVLVRADACRVCRTGHVVDGLDHPGICRMFRPESGGRPGAMHVCLPIVQSGSVGCVVQLVMERDESQLVHYMLPFLKVYLRETAPVLEAKRLMQSLRETTVRDQMTGLYNRRFLEEYVDTLVAGARRRNKPISVLMLDLDHFKKVNDTYGHAAGDKLLTELARVIRQSLRASDVAVRYGGEEFMAVLPDTDHQGGMVVAEKIRRAVEDMRIQVAGTVLQKTVSVGVAEFPGDGDAFWQVVEYADLALYRAKHSGRNQVVRFTSDLSAGSENPPRDPIARTA